MSVINQMLQELEQRRIEGGNVAAQVRAVPRQGHSHALGPWVVAALAVSLAAAAGGYWLANRQGVKPAAPPPTARPLAAPVAVPPVTAPLPAPAPVAAAETPVEPSVLQLASELSELPAAPQRPTPTAHPQIRQASVEGKVNVEAPASPAAPSFASAEKPPKASVEARGPKPAEGAAGAAINKEIKQISPRQRAENAYLQAYASLQQGRVGEAEEGLRQALQHDPRHAAARQALAALLVETKRLDRAEQLLQQGLELLPGHSGFAMTLARLQVERGDSAAALGTLERNPPAADSGDYHGFLAALLQRAERHKEAVEHYQAALRSNPNAGPWLLGLGISLQADNQPGKAAEAYRRARVQGNLSPELQSFAEQRLKQVQ